MERFINIYVGPAGSGKSLLARRSNAEIIFDDDAGHPASLLMRIKEACERYPQDNVAVCTQSLDAALAAKAFLKGEDCLIWEVHSLTERQSKENQQRRLLDRTIWQVLDELNAALEKHPKWPADPIHAAAIIGEEAGELMRAALQFSYRHAEEDAEELEPELAKAMAKEAAQTACVCLRFLANLKNYFDPKPIVMTDQLTLGEEGGRG